MKQFAACNLAVSFCAALLAFSTSALAADGNVLINQDTSTSPVSLGCGSYGFPIVICQPGSYRLSGNLRVPNANTTAISIRADNVTLDLNGFSILGPTICRGNAGSTTCSPTGGGFGVDAAAFQGLTVVNGNVSGMGSDGINSLAGDAYIAKVHAKSNGRAGISLFGGTVIENTASLNGGAGIDVGSGTVSGNYVFSNRLKGISASNSTISGNTALSNGDDGIFAQYSTVSGNTANSNARDGIRVICPSVVMGNAAVDNPPFQNIVIVGTCTVVNNYPQ